MTRFFNIVHRVLFMLLFVKNIKATSLVQSHRNFVFLSQECSISFLQNEIDETEKVQQNSYSQVVRSLSI